MQQGGMSFSLSATIVKERLLLIRSVLLSYLYHYLTRCISAKQHEHADA